MNHTDPIVLGLAGGAATGKTSVADSLAPMAQFLADDGNPIFWYHLFFAMPLYEMAAIRQKMIGIDAFDRQCFALHESLNNLFKGWITYEETVDTVFELASMECPPLGTKPRTFLQKSGTEICRSFDPDCFTKWVDRKTKEEFMRFKEAVSEFETSNSISLTKDFGVVVSDARFINECKFINDQAKGILIKFITRPEVAAERIYNRDNVIMTKEQLMHQSEQELLTVPDDMFDAIIDSSDMTIKEQVNAVKSIIEERLHG